MGLAGGGSPLSYLTIAAAAVSARLTVCMYICMSMYVYVCMYVCRDRIVRIVRVGCLTSL